MLTGQIKSRLSALDEKDIQILKVLQQDARLSMREIAGKVHLSPTPTQERIRRLEKDKVILNYAALLDPKKVSKGTVVFCHVTIKEHNKKNAQEFIDDVLMIDEISECYNAAGDFDFILKINMESIEAYHDFFVNRLSEVRHIGQKKSIFVMNVIKQSHVLV